MSIRPHPADAPLRPWQMSWNGRTWHHMPGATEDDQKLNFALYRRGLLEVDPHTGMDAYDADGNPQRLTSTYRRNFGSVGRKRCIPTAERLARDAARREAQIQRERHAAEKARVRLLLSTHVTRRGIISQIAVLAGIDADMLGRFHREGRQLGPRSLALLTTCLQRITSGEIHLDHRTRKQKHSHCPPGHIPFRQWIQHESARRRITPASLRNWLYKNPAHMPPLHRHNRRVFFVPLTHLQQHAA